MAAQPGPCPLHVVDWLRRQSVAAPAHEADGTSAPATSPGGESLGSPRSWATSPQQSPAPAQVQPSHVGISPGDVCSADRVAERQHSPSMQHTADRQSRRQRFGIISANAFDTRLATRLSQQDDRLSRVERISNSIGATAKGRASQSSKASSGDMPRQPVASCPRPEVSSGVGLSLARSDRPSILQAAASPVFRVPVRELGTVQTNRTVGQSLCRTRAGASIIARVRCQYAQSYEHAPHRNCTILRRPCAMTCPAASASKPRTLGCHQRSPAASSPGHIRLRRQARPTA